MVEIHDVRTGDLAGDGEQAGRWTRLAHAAGVFVLG
jgi:hypothetical protein